MSTNSLDRTESISRFCNITSESRRNLAPIQGIDKLPLVSLKEAVKPLASLVPQIDRMLWTVERYYDESKDNLSKDETTSVMLYTLEWIPSQNSFYFILNSTLRSQNREQLIPWLPYLRLFINAISKLPTSRHQIIYRGIQMDLSNEYPEGKEFIWWPFTSCTSSLKVLEKYIGQNGTRTIFNIICHSGKDISQHSYYREEKEILCYPARQFQVKSCINTGNQLHIIQLEETEPILPCFHIPPTSNFSNEQLQHTNSAQTSVDNITLHRRAICSSDNLGCLYDINRDCIVKRLDIKGVQRTSQSYQRIQCEIINGLIDKNKNLLKIINIENELRLSILLNLTAKTGIASLMDYTRSVDEYTRFLHYLYIDREEQLPTEILKTQKCFQSFLVNTDVTHMITGITVGIELIVVLQLPSDNELVKKIDNVLDNIRDIFKGNRKYSSLTSDDENILQTIIHTKIYSNIPQLMEMTSLLDLCRCRNIAKKKDSTLHPLIYTLQPIDKLFPHLKVIFTLLPTQSNLKVEEQLIKSLLIIKRLKYSLDHHINRSLPSQLQKEIRNQWQCVEDMYEKEIEYFQNLMFSIRISQDNMFSEIDRALNEPNQINLKDRIKQLIQHIDNLDQKGRFLNDLQQQNFRYYNVNELKILHDETEQSLERKLIIDERYDRVLCSNDTLYMNNQSDFDQLYSQLIQERQNNSQLNLIYADFSYCSFKLNRMMILPSNRLVNNMNINKQTRSTSLTESHSSLRSLTSTDEFINILLLGETNTGKSTLINAFVNYLKFETFNQAESHKPTVLIPVSFSIIHNNHLEEQVISLADLDNSKYEDFNHPGQSITQCCKSYIFNYPHYDGRKLRFIDTSGFGDIRGKNQDILNMEYILKYIKHFSYLNAICFLFKSNTVQMKEFFGTCLRQLSEFLGPTASKNLIFCLTNTRSNSSHLENTIQLIRRTLNLSSMKDAPLKKENIFYFDNESFRYLVASENGLQFNDEEKQQYENSWSTSVNESNRLIDYIHNNLIPCRLNSKYQSMKQAQLEILLMIRPILETIRNILRNIILQKMNLTREFIQLNPKTIHRTAAMCLSCKSSIDQIGNFWIMTDTPHEIEETCYNCSCSSNQHIPMDYILEYELSDHFFNNNQYQMKDILSKLRSTSVEFAFFLMYVASSTKEDPFNHILTRMINDENNLCFNHQSNQFNLQLVNDLKMIQNDHELRITNMKRNYQNGTVADIYKYIYTIREYPMIREQMIAIKQGQEILMKQYEYEVSNDLINIPITETATF